jgi:phospholipase C
VYYQAKIFWKWVYTQRAFNIPDPDDHLAPIDNFFAAIDAGTLPRFSYLEPIWLGSHVFDNGNSYHPPAQLEPGEEFLRKLFGKLTAKPDVWSKTLLMITFDEHGGTYDHVPPPCATPPWGDSAPPDPEHGFGFDRFGVRVPTVLASPWIEERTVFRSTTDVPYDHTSMIATVLTWMGVPRDEWNLGERVACAPTFEGVITRDRPRTEVPVFGAARECGRA